MLSKFGDRMIESTPANDPYLGKPAKLNDANWTKQKTARANLWRVVGEPRQLSGVGYYLGIHRGRTAESIEVCGPDAEHAIELANLIIDKLNKEILDHV